MAASDVRVEFADARKVAIEEATSGVPFAKRWVRVQADTSDAWCSAYERGVEIPGAGHTLEHSRLVPAPNGGRMRRGYYPPC